MRLGAMNLWQRALLAVALIVVFALVGRRMAADTIALHGDDFVVRLDRGLAFYQRALQIDPGNPVAVRGIAETASLSHNPRAIARAIDLIDSYVAAQPRHDALFYAILKYRAFMYNDLGDYARAVPDFALLGDEQHDPSMYQMAGRMALSAGDHPTGRRLILLSHQLDPNEPTWGV